MCTKPNYTAYTRTRKLDKYWKHFVFCCQRLPTVLSFYNHILNHIFNTACSEPDLFIGTAIRRATENSPVCLMASPSLACTDGLSFFIGCATKYDYNLSKTVLKSKVLLIKAAAALIIICARWEFAICRPACLHLLCYHETAGEVPSAKWGKIINRNFLFLLTLFFRLGVPVHQHQQVKFNVANHRGTRCGDPKRPSLVLLPVVALAAAVARFCFVATSALCSLLPCLLD